MKKIISLIICTALLIISLVGCGGESEIQAPTDELNLEFYYDDRVTVSYISFKTNMEETIEAYKLKYPNVAVNAEFKPIEHGSDYGEGDYRKMATEIMAGSGSDIIMMGDLFIRVNDVYKIQQSGAFADLTPYMQNDSEYKTDNLVAQVIDSVKTQDKQYIMPTRYSAPLFLGNKASFEKAGLDSDIFKNTDAIVKGLTDYYETNVGNKNMPSLFQEIKWLSYFPLFMNISLANYENQSVDIDDYFERGLDFFKTAYQKESEFINPSPIQGLSLLQQLNQGTVVADFLLHDSGLSKLIVESRMIAKTDDPVIQPWRNQEGGLTVLISEAMAINNSSKNKHNAWNFIKLCLLDDSLYQFLYCNSLSGHFPVNNESLKKFVKEKSEEALIDENDMPLTVLTAKQQESIIKLTDEISEAILPTQMHRGMVNILNMYAEDEITKEECLKQIEDYLEIYISE